MIYLTFLILVPFTTLPTTTGVPVTVETCTKTCQNRADGLYASPENCLDFYRCSNGLISMSGTCGGAGVLDYPTLVIGVNPENFMKTFHCQLYFRTVCNRRVPRAMSVLLVYHLHFRHPSERFQVPVCLQQSRMMLLREYLCKTKTNLKCNNYVRHV